MIVFTYICLSGEQMNLVDTPGTNVILQRQQRLTEEFVPRADLILFVLSSDRPLTESEVSLFFLLICFYCYFSSTLWFLPSEQWNKIGLLQRSLWVVVYDFKTFACIIIFDWCQHGLTLTIVPHLYTLLTRVLFLVIDEVHTPFLLSSC